MSSLIWLLDTAMWPMPLPLNSKCHEFSSRNYSCTWYGYTDKITRIIVRKQGSLHFVSFLVHQWLIEHYVCSSCIFWMFEFWSGVMAQSFLLYPARQCEAMDEFLLNQVMSDSMEIDLINRWSKLSSLWLTFAPFRTCSASLKQEWVYSLRVLRG